MRVSSGDSGDSGEKTQGIRYARCTIEDGMRLFEMGIFLGCNEGCVSSYSIVSCIIRIVTCIHDENVP